MAGSYRHCIGSDGKFSFDMIENMGDAHEACEEMFAMIQAFGRVLRSDAIDWAHKEYLADVNPAEYSHTIPPWYSDKHLRSKIADEIEQCAREYVSRWCNAPGGDITQAKAQGWAILQAAAHVRKGK